MIFLICKNHFLRYSYRVSTSRHLSKVIVQPEHKFNSSTIKTSLGNFLLEPFCKNKSWSNNIAILDGTTNQHLTYQDTFNTIYKVASALRNMGLKKGYGIAIISPNHLHFLTILAGTSIFGGYTIPINPQCSESEMKYQLELSEAKIIFVHPTVIEKVIPVANTLKIKVISLNDDGSSSSSSGSGSSNHGSNNHTINSYSINRKSNNHDSNSSNSQISVVPSFQEFISNENMATIDIESFIDKNFNADSIAIVPFSSGTTGKSKGVMLTHRNLISNIIQVSPYFEGKQLGHQATLVPIPFYHIYGMVVGMFVPLTVGRKIIYLSSFEIKRYLQLIHLHRVKRSPVVPPVIIALAKHPMVDIYDLSSLECLVSAAAPLGGDVQDACSTRLNCNVIQAWGMTELSPIGTVFSEEDIQKLDSVKGNSGKLVPGTEGKIVHPETGVDLLSTEEGEILIRGPQVMKGYLKNPEATKSTLRSDGWLHTGDIGHFDENGYLYITDRSKELIKYKGFQVPPAELEAILLTMPQLKDAIVIPVLDEEAGEIPRAYVVKQSDAPSNLTEQNVVDYVNARVSPQKKLRGGVRFTKSIPKSASGKLLRRVQIQIDRGQIP